MGAPIFISHSSKDQKVARTICTALENRGLACWIAGRDVHPGDNFQESIVRAIRDANVMILVFTGNANNSAEIKKELALASQHKLIVVPARLEDVMPSEALAYELATRQWINLFDDWENQIQELARRLEALLSTYRAGDVAAASERVARNPADRTPPRSGNVDRTSGAHPLLPRFAALLLAASGPLFISVLVASGVLSKGVSILGMIILVVTVAAAGLSLIVGVFAYRNGTRRSVLVACGLNLGVICVWLLATADGEFGAATIAMALSTVVYTAICLLNLFYYALGAQKTKTA